MIGLFMVYPRFPKFKWLFKDFLFFLFFLWTILETEANIYGSAKCQQWQNVQQIKLNDTVTCAFGENGYVDLRPVHSPYELNTRICAASGVLSTPNSSTFDSYFTRQHRFYTLTFESKICGLSFKFKSYQTNQNWPKRENDKLALRKMIV